MFWDIAAKFYDVFEKFYNKEVNENLVKEVSSHIEATDIVLECACGTGMITKGIAPKCKKIIATDFSEGMLKEARKNCASFKNVQIQHGNIMAISFKDNAFDKVVAGNVVHLLDQPYVAIQELMRVCKKGGQVIIPTYVNNEKNGKPSLFIRFLETFGAKFQKQFDYASYQKFILDAGYKDVTFILVQGKMPCAIAIIRK